jgi:hypothetical protein
MGACNVGDRRIGNKTQGVIGEKTEDPSFPRGI